MREREREGNDKVVSWLYTTFPFPVLPIYNEQASLT